MKKINQYCSRTLGFTVLLLTALVSGCSSNSSAPPVINNPAAPTVTATNPDTAATAVAVNNNVTATFSEAMDGTTIDTSSFTVQGAGEAALVGAVSLDAASNTAIFNPDSNFTASTVYTATITTAAKSSTAAALASNYVWTFTSGATADSTAPAVSSTDPIDTATGVALNRSISAVFNESLDPASVDSASFTLTADAGATSITGAVSYANKLVTLNPSSDLAASTLYTATLTTAITDLASNPLAANVVWSFTTGSAIATGPAPVNLRTAGDFAVLAKTGISASGVAGTIITGDIGVSPIDLTAITGFSETLDASGTFATSTLVVGNIYAANLTDPTPAKMTAAISDMETAYTDAAGRTTPDFTELHAGDISGQTLVPGLYKWGTNVLINTDTTLSGGANDVWIFQVSGNVIQAANSSVFLIGGALPKNVFWQVAGGTGVALDTDALFQGVVLAVAGITVNTGTTVNGRLLAQSAITLEGNPVTQPAP
jgi:hypothetical protein